MISTNYSDGAARDKKSQQLKDWTGSEIDAASSDYHQPTRVTFPLSVKLMAACYAIDKTEYKKLLAIGANVNAQNSDGMTCAHQCCISNEVDFLKFLIDEGADVNIQDNDGWTPLHAASSVGSEEAIRILLESGADVSMLTWDMELPLDVASTDDVKSLLKDAMERLGLDSTKLRNREEQQMLKDAKHWMETGVYSPLLDPRTGASPLHVAACKEYTSVLAVLLMLPGLDVDARDLDGWTPLHAAAHWNCEQAARMLCESGASFDVYTFSNMSVFDVADKDIIVLLRQLRNHQRSAGKRTQNIFETTPGPIRPLDAENVSMSDDDDSTRKSSICSASSSLTASPTTQDNGDQHVASDLKMSPEGDKSIESDAYSDSVESSSESSNTSSVSREATPEDTTATSSVPSIVSTASTPAVDVASVSTFATSRLTDNKSSIDQHSDLDKTSSTTKPQLTTPPCTTDCLSNGIIPSASHIGSRINRLMDNYVKSPEDPHLLLHHPIAGPTANSDISSESVESIETNVPKPSKETETQRSVKARIIRQSRRSTQRVTLTELEEAKQLMDSNNNNDTIPSISQSPFVASDSALATPHQPTVLVGRNQNRPDKVNESLSGIPFPSLSHSSVPPTKTSSTITTKPFSSNLDDTSGTADSNNTYRHTLNSFRKFDPTDTSVITNDRQLSPKRSSFTGRSLLNSNNRKKLIETTQNLERLVHGDKSADSKSLPGIADSLTDLHRIIPRPSSPFIKKHPELDRNTPPRKTTTPPVTGTTKWSTSTTFSSAYNRFSRPDQSAIDYQHLYEKEKLEKERLVRELERVKKEQKALRNDWDQIMLNQKSSDARNSNNNHTAAFPTDDLHSRLVQYEDQVKEVTTLREENNRLKDENASLIRVISKLSRPSG